ncbi:MAG TPA: hypothetical protein VFA50_06335 [Stellaceae bacterium]|nr:hypothetical protein [Stellaceae bacterium]
MMVFEVQRNVGGQWRSYALFDEKTLAVDAAKDVMKQKRPPAAVRVVQDSGDGSPPRTIFRQASVDGHNEQAHRQRLELEREVEAMRVQRKQERLRARALAGAARARAEARRQWVFLLLRVLLVLSGALGALGFVRYELIG